MCMLSKSHQCNRSITPSQVHRFPLSWKWRRWQTTLQPQLDLLHTCSLVSPCDWKEMSIQNQYWPIFEWTKWYWHYLGNIKPSIKDSDLVELCHQYGEVLSFKMQHGKPHNFAFVNFRTVEDCQTAHVALNGIIADGVALKTNFKACNKPEKCPGCKK